MNKSIAIMNDDHDRSDGFREDGELKIQLRLLIERVRLSLLILLMQRRLEISQASLTARQKVTLKKRLMECREYRILLKIYPLLMK